MLQTLLTLYTDSARVHVEPWHVFIIPRAGCMATHRYPPFLEGLERAHLCSVLKENSDKGPENIETVRL